MKTLSVVFVLLTGCAAQVGDVDWPSEVKCAADARVDLCTADARFDLVYEMSEVFDREKNPRHELEGMARTQGPAAVICLVDLMRKEYMQVWAVPKQREISKRAQEFLDDVGTEIK